MLDQTKKKTFSASIQEADISSVQRKWAEGIMEIGRAFKSGEDFRKITEDLIDDLYAFEGGPVLFKPTLASKVQFRPMRDDALSYFVRGVHDEDGGFALKPWKFVRFGEQEFSIHGDQALAMGNYYFTPYDNDEETKVEFSFAYRLMEDGKLRIVLHHSSVPYSPS